MKKGIQIYTDKTHVKQKQEIFPALTVTAAKKFSLSEKPVVENFKGFGVAITVRLRAGIYFSTKRADRI